MVEKNWRGLPEHTVDQWDSWELSIEEYQNMVLTYDIVRDCMGQALADMSLVFDLMGFATRYQRLMQAQDDAGIDI